ncbi:GmrSD restriction endonuclease domain-containing protein [Chryseobacterium sp. S-02]|uniref:GmrSD restriction endonuclease domain-containing protein n=1 Tax=Chryseobacterium sp. S-02 TaxID=3404064 RepID=UPI003CF126D3
MKISITEVPQADELNKVILTVEAVQNDYKSDQKIADYVGFTDRQGRYYRLAAEILGLLKNENNSAFLTKTGNELIILDEENRLKKIRTILRQNHLFDQILSKIESDEEGLSRSQILDFLLVLIEGAESTITRRYSTIINWLHYSKLIVSDIRELPEDDKETVYKVNNELDESDYIYDSNFKDSIYPADYSNEELDIKESHMQVVTLLRRHSQDKIVIPPFQRNQVWKQQQKSKFIESLILNIPIPPFYISQDLDGKMIVVDGLQRSSAIFDFLKGAYHLAGLEALPDLNGKYYNDLDADLQTRIEDRELLLYILKPSVPMSIVYDIFNRINSNGTPLTRQEIRNCIYIGQATMLLAELSESIEFRRAIGNGIPSLRMKDREAILRFFAFTNANSVGEYKGDLDDFLGKAMRRINRMSVEEIDNLKTRFFRVMNLTYDFFGSTNFRLPTSSGRGRINIALLECISSFFDNTDDQDLINNKQLIQYKYYNILLNDLDFRESIRISTGSPLNVRTRFNKTFEILNLP